MELQTHMTSELNNKKGNKKIQKFATHLKGESRTSRSECRQAVRMFGHRKGPAFVAYCPDVKQDVVDF